MRLERQTGQTIEDLCVTFRNLILDGRGNEESVRGASRSVQVRATSSWITPVVLRKMD